jgi:predicted extracellular nuclease
VTAVHRPLPLLLCLSLVAGLAACTAPVPQPSARPEPIGAVQGAQGSSPAVGRMATVQGVVTATRVQGLAVLQDDGDGDPATSDALFLAGAVGLRPGLRIRARGTVVEQPMGRDSSLTTLQVHDWQPLGDAGLPPPVRLQGPPAHGWESLEGMRVFVDAPLATAGTRDFAGHGVLLAHFGPRQWAPTEVAAPGPAALAVQRDNLARRIVLEFADPGQRPPHAPRVGQTLREVAGIVGERDGSHRINAHAPAVLGPALRPEGPPRVAGDVRLAAFNLENLFNGDGRGGGFPTPRGARDAAQWQRQLDKHVAALHALDADVVALMELENDGDGPQSALAQLVAALNAGGGDWRAVPGADGGGDQIRVGLVYRAGRVTAVGRAAQLHEPPFGRLSRPPLAQAFRAGRGPVFVVAAVHFKSKGCRDATGADADQGDGQSCWNHARVQSSRQLHAWLQGDPTRSGSRLHAVLGDFNAYAMEDPIRLLLAAGWVDAFAGSDKRPYSYVFDGSAGRLDHALLSPALARRLRGAAKWHLNADEPASAGYAAGGPGPWRSSDHDPLLLGLALRAAAPD